MIILKFLPAVVFAKGCEFPLVPLWEGSGVGFRCVVRGCFPVAIEGKGDGGGVRWGQAKEPASQCASAFVKTTL